MKKAGIITFLHNDNYGSTLQAWALQQALRQCGWKACHLDYAPDVKEKIRNQLLSCNSPALLLDGFRRRKVASARQGMAQKHRKFDAFREQHLQVTARCTNGAALSAVSQDCDLLIAGSDQIWSPVWFNPCYFLNFADEKRKISYAASMGVAAAPKGIKAKRMTALLRQFDSISVREQEGAEIVAGLIGKKPQVMPDPVMLVERDEWLQLADADTAVCDKPYLLCYFIGNREDYWIQARKLAEENDLQIVAVPVSDEAWLQPDTVIADGLGPCEWLQAIAGAELILTDSFHGACFSALLGRRFRVLRRYEDGTKGSKNSRIDQLMRLLNGADHEIMEPKRYGPYLQQIRQRGMQWLLDTLDRDSSQQI